MRCAAFTLCLAALPLPALQAQGTPATCRTGHVAAPAIDSTQLLGDLRTLAADSMEGRGFGTPGGARARAYLVRRLDEIGLDTVPGGRLQPVPGSKGGTPGANVIGVVVGTEPGRGTIVISAHYDHLGIRDGTIYNGADDNASGTAALLALARWFRDHPPRHRLVFVALDGEEAGLLGARAFVAAPPVPLSDMRLNLNFDMVARGDRGDLYVVGPAHYPSLTALVDQAACAAQVKLMLGHDKGSRGGDDWTNQSDQAAFHARGIPFLYFGVEDHPDYHRATDDVERVDPGFLARAVRTLLAAALVMDGADIER